DNLSIHNDANVTATSSGGNVSDSAFADVPVAFQPTPALALDKQVVGVDTAGNGILDHAGETIDYDLVVTNTGNETLTGVTVVDPLTGTNVNEIGRASCRETAENSEYSITQQNITRNATIRTNNVDAGQIANTATADSDQTAPTTDSAQVPIGQSPAPVLDRQVGGVDTAGNGILDHAGETIDYDLVVTNTGNETLTGVTVVDPLTGTNVN